MRPAAPDRARPWASFLGDPDARGLGRPEFAILDGAPGLEAALAEPWGEDLPIQRCTVHEHRTPGSGPGQALPAHAPGHLHAEIGEGDRDMIHAATAGEVAGRRTAFPREWRLKCRAVADSLAEAGDRLFTFTRRPPSQWKAARTMNAMERLNEEFRRRIETQTVPPAPETRADAAPGLRALLASGQIRMRKADGREPNDQPLDPPVLDAAA